MQAEQIASHERFEIVGGQPFFKEFVVRDRRGQVDQLLAVTRTRQACWAGYPWAHGIRSWPIAFWLP